MPKNGLSQIIYLPYLMNFFTRDFKPQFEDTRLKEVHFRTLFILRDHKDMTMSDVSHMVDLEKGSFTTVADRLVTLGYAVRKRSEEDRRKVILELTPQGIAFINEADQQLIAHASSVLERLPPEIVEDLIEALDKIAHLAQAIKNL